MAWGNQEGTPTFESGIFSRNSVRKSVVPVLLSEVRLTCGNLLSMMLVAWLGPDRDRQRFDWPISAMNLCEKLFTSGGANNRVGRFHQMATVHGSNRPGDLICSAKMLPPKSVPSWGMYLISLGCALLAAMFIVIAIDGFMQSVPGAAQSGAVALLIGAIFLACAIAAFLSGWKTQKARDVKFYSEGIAISSGDDETFIHYADVDDIEIQLIDPSSGDHAKHIAQAAMSLAAGNVAGIGYALGKTASYGIVQIKIPNETQPCVFQFDLATATRIADEADSRRS